MLEELAAKLQMARQERRLSLEAVAKLAKISTAYLHKLEQGRVGSPSPRVLRRLAGALKLRYLALMEASGYLDRSEAKEAARRRSSPRPHPLAGQELTAEEWRAVGAFIQALQANRTPVAAPGREAPTRKGGVTP